MAQANQRRTLTSAWIETINLTWTDTDMMVALSRVRGLKRITGRFDLVKPIVALSRVRGLKRLYLLRLFAGVQSHSHECVD